MDQKATQSISTPHQLILQDRNRLDITGVSDVDSFDDTAVIVFTSLGELTVKGKGLQVRQLDVDGGNLTIVGQIDVLSYSNAVRGNGFLGKLLR